MNEQIIIVSSKRQKLYIMYKNEAKEICRIYNFTIMGLQARKSVL